MAARKGHGMEGERVERLLEQLLGAVRDGFTDLKNEIRTSNSELKAELKDVIQEGNLELLKAIAKSSEDCADASADLGDRLTASNDMVRRDIQELSARVQAGNQMTGLFVEQLSDLRERVARLEARSGG